MNKLVLSLAIISALGLSGCGSETINDVKKNVENVTPTVAAARVVFDPANGILSTPNDLLFSGSQDGTLNIPLAEGSNYADPKFALNAIDGWSTAQPFVLGITFPTGVSLDASSVSNPASVRIFETIMGGDSSDSECVTIARGMACKVVGELTFGVDFVTKASGNSIAVVPLKPLKAKTGYLVALTNSLQDSTGRAIQGSETYDSVRQDLATKPLGTAAQKGLQAVINSYENAVSAAGADKTTLIYTMAMTTQSTVDVLGTIKALMAQTAPTMLANALEGIPTIGVQDTGMSVADILAGKIPASLVPLYSAANFMQGKITLPYYLGVPTQENPKAPVNTWWNSLCDSGAMLAGLAAADPSAIPAAPISVADGTCMAISQAKNLPAPGLRALGIDTERNLSKYSPVPKANAEMEVYVQMTTPDTAVATAVRASLGLPALVEPANGWPVVILQHGITSKKEDMLGLTGILSVYGLATVAINHPLHGDPDVFGGLLNGGSRGFDLDPRIPGDEINASTVSATHYMNLGSLLTTRDNLRQSTSDLLGLRLGLNFLGGFHTEGNPIKVDRTQVHYLGHSLGAITGINFMALTNSPLAPEVDPLFKVNTNSLAMPGIMVANLLMESGAFGDVIKSGLTYAQSTDFQGYVSQAHQGSQAPTEGEIVGYYRNFYAALTAEQQAGLNAIFAQFTFAAQTVTDAGDPINYIGAMAATQTPTHLIEVVGDGVNNLGDQVIPNRVSVAPISGTEAAIAMLGLPAITETTIDAENAVSGAVRFLFGHHGSILDPSVRAEAPDGVMTGAATTEMQYQVANFFGSNGHAIPVQNPEVVKQ